MKTILIIILTILFSFSAFAKPENFQLKTGKIKIDVAHTWQTVKSFLGIELMLVGPMKKTNRPVITIGASEFSGFELDEESLKKNESTYKDGREKWLQKYNGRSIEYFKYETSLLRKSIKMHSVGYRYILGEKEFIERSHYLICGKNIYHLKSLILLAEEPEQRKNINKMIESFSCE